MRDRGGEKGLDDAPEVTHCANSLPGLHGGGCSGRNVRRLVAALSLADFLLAPLIASAQEDVTPPVLTEISVVPSAFDAGRAEIALRACAIAEDDLSGIKEIAISSVPEDKGKARPTFDIVPGGGAPRIFEGCRDFVVLHSRPYTVFHLVTDVSDRAGNRRRYDDRAFFPGVDAEDLCDVGTCRLTNEPLSSAVDVDGNGIPDAAESRPDAEGDGDRDGGA